MFRTQFALEEQGADLASLAARWLVLDLRAFGYRRWQLSYELPEAVAHFLDDADIRAKDHKYAEWQRSHVREWLNA